MLSVALWEKEIMGLPILLGILCWTGGWLSLYFKGAGRVVYKCGHNAQVIFFADRNGLAGGQGNLITGYFYDVCHIDQITFMCPDECGTWEILFNLFQRSGKGVIFAGS